MRRVARSIRALLPSPHDDHPTVTFGEMRESGARDVVIYG